MGGIERVLRMAMAMADRMLRGLGVPRAARDDVRQEVLVAVWRGVTRGKVEWQSPSFRGFVSVVTTRAAMHWHRRSRIHLELQDEDATTEDNPERLLLAERMTRFLEKATTPDRWRAALAQAEGLETGAIAEAENVPKATVHTRLRLARSDFRRALARENATLRRRGVV